MKVKRMEAKTFRANVELDGAPALLIARVFLDAGRVRYVSSLKLYDPATERAIPLVTDGTLYVDETELEVAQ